MIIIVTVELKILEILFDKFKPKERVILFLQILLNWPPWESEINFL